MADPTVPVNSASAGSARDLFGEHGADMAGSGSASWRGIRGCQERGWHRPSAADERRTRCVPFD
ncbi:MAG: hypothetical protein M0Z63_06880 [Actinomycetota bacterium]|nr:hypothetical protein [Actinomycetota bacterium]